MADQPIEQVKPIREITVKDGEEMVEALKSSVALAMTDWEQRFIGITFPTREDFEQEEEYHETIVYMMTELVDSVRELKEELFKDMLNNYNEFLSIKIKTEEDAKEQTRKCHVVIGETIRDAKKTAAISVVITLLLPGLAPFVLMISIPKLALDLVMNQFSKYKMRHNAELLENLKTIQIPYFDFIDQMRTDYHQSNKELAVLMEKAKRGEDISKELLPMIQPERLSLSREKAKQLELSMKPVEPKKENN